MEKLTNYKFKTEIGEYVSERFKVDKGVYGYKISSNTELIEEKKDVKIKNGKDLNKRIRKIIKEYEENLEDPLAELEEKGIELDEKLEESEMEEAIEENLTGETEVIEEIDAEEEVEEFEEELDLGDEIDAVFKKRNSPIEMRKLFEKLDAEIKKLDGVNFKTTTLDLVYQVSGQNFLRIRPRSKDLYIMTAQDWYKDLVNLSEETEIDNGMIQIKKSYDLIKKKRSKKE